MGARTAALGACHHPYSAARPVQAVPEGKAPGPGGPPATPPAGAARGLRRAAGAPALRAPWVARPARRGVARGLRPGPALAGGRGERRRDRLAPAGPTAVAPIRAARRASPVAERAVAR